MSKNPQKSDRVWKNPEVEKNRLELKQDIIRFLESKPEKKERTLVFWKNFHYFNKSPSTDPAHYGCKKFKYLFDFYLDILVKNGGFYQLRGTPFGENSRLGGYSKNKIINPDTGMDIYEDGTFEKRIINILKANGGKLKLSEFGEVYNRSYTHYPRHVKNWITFPAGVSVKEDFLYFEENASSKDSNSVQDTTEVMGKKEKEEKKKDDDTSNTDSPAEKRKRSGEDSDEPSDVKCKRQ